VEKKYFISVTRKLNDPKHPLRQGPTKRVIFLKLNPVKPILAHTYRVIWNHNSVTATVVIVVGVIATDHSTSEARSEPWIVTIGNITWHPGQEPKVPGPTSRSLSWIAGTANKSYLWPVIFE